MFKIEAENNRYKISYGQRVKNYANSPEETINALKHYFALKHSSKKCPSCRESKRV